jgi:hypothetical protein
MVSLEITNGNPNKIVNHKGWGASAADFSGEERAAIKDDAGNEYKRCQFGFGTRVVGQVHGSESIYPNKTVPDLVVFEPPIDSCKYLILELPASAYGGDGKLRFNIPRSMWERGGSNASSGSGSALPDIDSQQKAQEAEKERERRKELAKQQEAARWHTWTSADGQHTIEAKFLKAMGDTIHLEKKDGSIIKVPRDKLSEDDWKWIMNKSWTKGTK